LDRPPNDFYLTKEQIEEELGVDPNTGRVDKILYDINGNIIGNVFKVRNIFDGGLGRNVGHIYFEGGILISLIVSGGSVSFYTSPPSAVFNNNSKSNRLIMELIFREKKDSKISSD
jgi:hypothetical protein